MVVNPGKYPSHQFESITWHNLRERQNVICQNQIPEIKRQRFGRLVKIRIDRVRLNVYCGGNVDRQVNQLL